MLIRIMMADYELSSLTCSQIKNYIGLFTRKTLRFIHKTHTIACSPGVVDGTTWR